METKKLYYEDPCLGVFTATVIECREEKDGWNVLLDQTAFYPEGGGQGADTGEIARIAVLDVQEENGCIFHKLEKPLLPGMTVHGKVDMARRMDYTQQHSADHILTGVIHNRYGFDNVGFHMGQESTFIDLNGILTESELLEMERVANEVVWMNLPIEISWPSAQELKNMDYRSKLDLEGAVRIVTVPGIDVCACCGTHVKNTGEVGMIKIISVAKLRGGVRVEYVAGRRAYEYLNEMQQQNHRISVELSAKALHTAAAVHRLKEEKEELQSRLAQMEKDRCAAIAEQMRGKGNVVIFEPALAADAIRRLADAVKETCGGVALVFSGDDAEGYKYAFAVQEGDIRNFVKEMNCAMNGRGGGRDANFVQGSLKASRVEIERYLKEETDSIEQ